MRLSISNTDKIEMARLFEKEGKFEEAEGLYISLIQKGRIDVVAYTRLMAVYRKQKLFEQELSIIKTAIKAYDESEQKWNKQWVSEMKKAARVSMGFVSVPKPPTV